MNDLSKCYKKVREIFFDAFITLNNELVLDRKTNVYFLLEDVKTELKFDCKMLAWLSRPAHKGMTKKQHQYFLNGLNVYFNQNWNSEDMSLIYTKLGNGINYDLTEKFIKSNFNLEILTS